MRNCEHLVDLKTEQYWKNEERIWKVLNSMTTREIALSSVGNMAQEAGVERNTLYKHRSISPYCRMQAKGSRKIEENTGGKK